MHPSLLSLIISTSTLTLLVLLFVYERRRGLRFVGGVRSLCDSGVFAVAAFMRRIGAFLEREVIRQTIHYFFHKFLRTVLLFLKRLETYTDGMLRTNKALAKRVAEDRKVRTKLDEMVRHREETALTPKQQKAHKERSIGTRL